MTRDFCFLVYGRSIPPPQPRPPPLQSSSALLRPVPQPLLLDTLPVFLDLPVLDLEPRSLQHWPQLCPWFPAPLSPSTQTSLGCCQTSLLLPLFAASLPLGDRTSLRWFPGEDLGPLRHPPVPRPTLRSALSARWGPMSPVHGPFLAAPEGLTHPQARPWMRAAMDIAGLESGWSFKGGGGWPLYGLCLKKTCGGMCRDLAKAYNSKIPIRGWEFYPSPDQCILEMVNSHLQMSAKGKNLLAKSLDNLVDGHILCCLANSFLPGTFTTEVLLNDRFVVSEPGSEDDGETPVCVVFIYIRRFISELGRLCTSYDVKSCQKWMAHAEKVQKKTWKYIRQKMKGRFETVTVPRNITITGLCLSLLIDLSLTRGGGFYLAREKETVARNRRIILQNKETGEYIDDFSGFQPHVSVRKILSLSATDVIEPRVYQKYKIFLESDSKNKILKKNSTFLYQVFPGSASHWQQLVFKALRSRDYTAVKDMVLFFRTTHNEVINTEDPSTGNTALHLACRSGHFETVLLLLENGASLNVRNKNGCTPCFFAAAGQHRSVCQLLIEWGCDFHAKDSRGQGPLDAIHSERLKEYLLGYSAFWSSAVPAIMHGGADVLYEIVQKHLQDVAGMASLRSRCINGSTLLHTAAYFGETDIIKTLLGLQVDVNLLDYKGATALHRARDSETMQFLIDHGADVNQKDDDGNTPVHMVCYGEQGKDTRLDCLRLLVFTTVKANRKGLLAIHCAAMQGRIDVIELLLQCDSDGQMQRKIQRAMETNSPSLLYLAVANDHLKCAEWLAMRSFTFKPTEQEELLYGLFQQEIARKEKTKTLEFLIKSGVSVNTVYAGGDSTLHLAALQTNLTELLALLLGQGADVNKLNDEQCSPLFYAVHVSNFHGAALLLENGAGVMLRDSQGLTAFDYIRSYDEWIESGLFSEEITTLLKGEEISQTQLWFYICFVINTR
ncbi:UNVERIFIED_CONTAM: hypothetical protein FKN15_056997 [Acipenser sinensis]